MHLKPEAGGGGMTQEQLIGELDAAVTVCPGWRTSGPSDHQSHQHAHHRDRSEVGVKLFGHDLTALEERARAVAAVLQRIPAPSMSIRSRYRGTIPRYPGQPRGCGALWHHGRSRPGCHRDSRGRDKPDADH